MQSGIVSIVERAQACAKDSGAAIGVGLLSLATFGCAPAQGEEKLSRQSEEIASLTSEERIERLLDTSIEATDNFTRQRIFGQMSRAERLEAARIIMGQAIQDKGNGVFKLSLPYWVKRENCTSLEAVKGFILDYGDLCSEFRRLYSDRKIVASLSVSESASYDRINPTTSIILFTELAGDDPGRAAE